MYDWLMVLFWVIIALRIVELEVPWLPSHLQQVLYRRHSSLSTPLHRSLLIIVSNQMCMLALVHFTSMPYRQHVSRAACFTGSMSQKQHISRAACFTGSMSHGQHVSRAACLRGNMSHGQLVSQAACLMGNLSHGQLVSQAACLMGNL